MMNGAESVFRTFLGGGVNVCFTNPDTLMHFFAALDLVEASAAAHSFELVEQHLCRFEIGGGEALGEPAVDRCEQVAGCGAATLVAPQSGKARGGAQLPQLGFLLSGDAEGLAI